MKDCIRIISVIHPALRSRLIELAADCDLYLEHGSIPSTLAIANVFIQLYNTSQDKEHATLNTEDV